jgi:IMP dehydrogenase
MQELYAEPIKRGADRSRIEEIKGGGVVACASLTPQRVEQYASAGARGRARHPVIQGTVVSGEHVSSRAEPLNLKEFIPASTSPSSSAGARPTPRPCT